MERFNPIFYLLFQAPRAMRLVNMISFVRVVAFPVLLVLMIVDNLQVFKWIILVCFITDALDGFLARKLNVTSILGSRLDSMADDLAIAAGLFGAIVFRGGFVAEQWRVVALVLAFYFIQLGFALLKYRKVTNFHTYGAKVAAVFQGVFLCALFFVDEPVYPLFYVAAAMTCLELFEEIIMVAILPKWRSDVRGLYWAMKLRSESVSNPPSD